MNDAVFQVFGNFNGYVPLSFNFLESFSFRRYMIRSDAIELLEDDG